jgi:hypothetical protein
MLQGDHLGAIDRNDESARLITAAFVKLAFGYTELSLEATHFFAHGVSDCVAKKIIGNSSAAYA